MRDDRLETVLRRALRPDPALATRVAEGAMAEQWRPGHTVLLRAAGALLAALLLVVAITTLRPRTRPPRRTAAVFSVGDLVVGVSPDASTWIVSGGVELDPGRVCITVVKGERE